MKNKLVNTRNKKIPILSIKPPPAISSTKKMHVLQLDLELEQLRKRKAKAPAESEEPSQTKQSEVFLEFAGLKDTTQGMCRIDGLAPLTGGQGRGRGPPGILVQLGVAPGSTFFSSKHPGSARICEGS